ncbi:MAG TPA: response regulator transcription factor [Dehalococcoidia bacterium]|nr:response regulator transcription factor [Dehalococcoidia bacterium]
MILVVDDDPKIRRLLKVELRAHEYRTAEAANGNEALDQFDKRKPWLVLLDLMLPDMDGLEVLRRIREHSPTPVVVVSAKTADLDRIRGLQLGADDYIVKPFNPEEVVERVKAVLRRTRQPRRRTEGRRVDLDNVVIDLDGHSVTVEGRPVALSPKEWQLLEQLATHPGRTLLHEDLLERTWGQQYRDDVQFLRVWISRLRQKIERNPAQPRLIRTVQGVGYVLDTSPQPPDFPPALVASSNNN